MPSTKPISGTSQKFDAESAKANAKKQIDEFFDQDGSKIEEAFKVAADFGVNALETSTKSCLLKNVTKIVKPLIGSAAKASVQSSRASAHASAKLSINLYARIKSSK